MSNVVISTIARDNTVYRQSLSLDDSFAITLYTDVGDITDIALLSDRLSIEDTADALTRLQAQDGVLDGSSSDGDLARALFDSGDLVFAFSDGGYATGASAAIPEPSTLTFAQSGVRLPPDPPTSPIWRVYLRSGVAIDTGRDESGPAVGCGRCRVTDRILGSPSTWISAARR